MNDLNPPEKNVQPEENIQTVPSELSEENQAHLIFQRKIGGTTYIVTSEFNENAREGLLDKLWRLIENDND